MHKNISVANNFYQIILYASVYLSLSIRIHSLKKLPYESQILYWQFLMMGELARVGEMELSKLWAPVKYFGLLLMNILSVIKDTCTHTQSRYQTNDFVRATVCSFACLVFPWKKSEQYILNNFPEDELYPKSSHPNLSFGNNFGEAFHTEFHRNWQTNNFSFCLSVCVCACVSTPMNLILSIGWLVIDVHCDFALPSQQTTSNRIL